MMGPRRREPRTVLRAWLALACGAAVFLTGARDAGAQQPRPVPVPPTDSASAAATPGDSASGVPLRDVTDLYHDLFHRQVETEVVREMTTGLSLSILPSIGYNPSSGAFIGAGVALAGWFADRATTQLSSGSVGASYSSSGQVSVQFKSDFYLPHNQWALKGDWRYLDTSQETFGLGPASGERQPYPMDFVLYRLHQVVYRRVQQSAINVGLGYHFDRYEHIRDERAERGESTPFTEYSGGAPSRTQSAGLSVNLLTDTRDNPINASRGLLWRASMRSYLRELGSDANAQVMWSDFRYYVKWPEGGRNVLATWSTMWFTFGKMPYLDLPAIGWDTYGRGGRGYLQGTIRGTNQVYTEFEYRMRFSRDDMWGGVTFLNLTATTAPGSSSFGSLDPGYGVGLRMKFSKRSNTNLAVDAARGQDEVTRYFFGLQEVY